MTMGQLKISLKGFFVVIVLLLALPAAGHPMPNSVVNLSVSNQILRGEAKMPLTDFLIAFGTTGETLQLNSPAIRSYFSKHIRVVNPEQKTETKILRIEIKESKDPIVGKYKELWVYFACYPLPSARKFTFAYDVILHQIITHKILVYVDQDWEGGLLNVPQQVGEIALDIPKGQYFPLPIDLGEGSWWKGFQSMISLGMHHIAEGSDHLLFLCVLLLPGMLIAQKNRWVSSGGISHGFKHMLGLITAFTLGHSLTLIAGVLHLIDIPESWVEIWIAISILLSAIHAYRPLFTQQEFWIVLFFGFIHGMAFAAIFNEMHLETGQLIWSILGFNLGIECMQILLMAVAMPLIIWLSSKSYFVTIRKSGAILAGFMAIYWLWERM